MLVQDIQEGLFDDLVAGITGMDGVRGEVYSWGAVFIGHNYLKVYEAEAALCRVFTDFCAEG